MAKPQTVEELNAVLNAYFSELHEWQGRVNKRLEEVEKDETDDPPPRPPDVG